MRYQEFKENRISGVPTLAGGATDKFKKAKQKVETLGEDDEDTLNPPSISKGDEVKTGKFKNSKATVKGFKKDDHNQPVLKTNKGDKKLFSLRLSKLQQEEAPPGREKQVKALKGKVDNPYAVAWASYNKSKSKSKG